MTDLGGLSVENATVLVSFFGASCLLWALAGATLGQKIYHRALAAICFFFVWFIVSFLRQTSNGNMFMELFGGFSAHIYSSFVPLKSLLVTTRHTHSHVGESYLETMSSLLTLHPGV